MTIFTLIFLFVPLLYIFLVSTAERDEDGLVSFDLQGGLIILVLYMFTLIFVESNDKPTYLEYYLDAENFYGDFTREVIWGKLQIFLSSFLMKNELLYWLFYSFVYCLAYFVVARKLFPYEYAGYFVLCVVGCMGFVSYGSNTIRAGFGIALLLMAFSSDNRWLKCLLPLVAVGCNMPMLIPFSGYLIARYIMRKDLWCECIWVLFLLITLTTSVVSDIMLLAGGLDDRAAEFVNVDETTEVYNVGFRTDFLLYSLIPVLFVKYNVRNLVGENLIYHTVYRAYLLVNALWLLLIRLPFTDRFAYLSWFMIPFLLMYPVLNEQLDTQRPQRYVLSAIGIFFLVNAALMLKSS